MNSTKIAEAAGYLSGYYGKSLEGLHLSPEVREECKLRRHVFDRAVRKGRRERLLGTASAEELAEAIEVLGLKGPIV